MRLKMSSQSIRAVVPKFFWKRGTLKKSKCSAKHKILNYIAAHGPLEQISRTTFGPRNRLRESLFQIKVNKKEYAWKRKSKNKIKISFQSFNLNNKEISVIFNNIKRYFVLPSLLLVYYFGLYLVSMYEIDCLIPWYTM